MFQIEDILKEKITEYWKNVSSALLDYDYKNNSHISHRNLKKVLDNYVLPVSDEHMQKYVFASFLKSLSFKLCSCVCVWGAGVIGRAAVSVKPTSKLPLKKYFYI